MAALAAMNAHEEDDLEKRRQLENALEQARFEVTRKRFSHPTLMLARGMLQSSC